MECLSRPWPTTAFTLAVIFNHDHDECWWWAQGKFFPKHCFLLPLDPIQEGKHLITRPINTPFLLQQSKIGRLSHDFQEFIDSCYKTLCFFLDPLVIQSRLTLAAPGLSLSVLEDSQCLPRIDSNFYLKRPKLWDREGSRACGSDHCSRSHVLERHSDNCQSLTLTFVSL